MWLRKQNGSRKACETSRALRCQIHHLADDYVFEALSGIQYLSWCFCLRDRTSCILICMVLGIKPIMWVNHSNCIASPALRTLPLWLLWGTLICPQAIWVNIVFIMCGKSRVKLLMNCIGHWSLVLVKQQWQKTQLAWRWARNHNTEYPAPQRAPKPPGERCLSGFCSGSFFFVEQ